jgi:hypothetical protein
LTSSPRNFPAQFQPLFGRGKGEKEEKRVVVTSLPSPQQATSQIEAFRQLEVLMGFPIEPRHPTSSRVPFPAPFFKLSNKRAELIIPIGKGANSLFEAELELSFWGEGGKVDWRGNLGEGEGKGYRRGRF